VSVDRRRAGGTPALWRRIRWGNLARLCAVLGAAGFLIVVADRGGQAPPSPAPPAALDPPRDGSIRQPSEKSKRRRMARPRAPEARRPRERHKGRPRGRARSDGARRPDGTAVAVRPVTTLVTAPAPAAALPAAPPPRPRLSSSEFLPDPGP